MPSVIDVREPVTAAVGDEGGAEADGRRDVGDLVRRRGARLGEPVVGEGDLAASAGGDGQARRGRDHGRDAADQLQGGQPASPPAIIGRRDAEESTTTRTATASAADTRGAPTTSRAATRA